MRILITGITGFIGGHLVERLRQEKLDDLHGASLRGSWPPEWQHLNGQAALHTIDLSKADGLVPLLGDLRPEWIFHLAGFANPAKSFHEPAKAWEDNWRTTFNLYEAVSVCRINPRILFVSSGLIYGNPAADQPISETDLLCPASPYAASKAAADLLSYQVSRHPGLDVMRVRCFNQIGPRQAPDYATANFARQIAAIETGRQPPLLETGDLSSKRDLTDVRDLARAFVLLMKSGKAGEAYNAGSCCAYSMQSILERMLALSRIPITVRQNIDPNRRADTAIARADNRKLRESTGWTPEYSLERSLAELLDYWRQTYI